MRLVPVADPVRPDPASGCGAVQVGDSANALVVIIPRSGVDCATARRVADAYLNDKSIEAEGSGRYKSIGNWTCGGVSIRDLTASGVALSCRTDTAAFLLGVA